MFIIPQMKLQVHFIKLLPQRAIIPPLSIHVAIEAPGNQEIYPRSHSSWDHNSNMGLCGSQTALHAPHSTRSSRTGKRPFPSMMLLPVRKYILTWDSGKMVPSTNVEERYLQCFLLSCTCVHRESTGGPGNSIFHTFPIHFLFHRLLTSNRELVLFDRKPPRTIVLKMWFLGQQCPLNGDLARNANS